MLGALTLLAIASLSVVSVIALNYFAVSIPNTISLSTAIITVSTPVTASGIQVAVNAVVAAGGGTVYIPAGDWVVNQTAVTYSSGMLVGGGAIFIDLETLPAGAWLNIIGSYNNVTTTQQNGMSITCPATILRSDVVNNGYLPSTIDTFAIVGSIWHNSANNNYVNSANRHIRISGLTILGDVTNDSGNNNDGIDIECVDGFLIDHCFIDSNVGADITVDMSKGVIADCNIWQAYHVTWGGLWGYGVEVFGNSNLWHNGFGTSTWITNLAQVVGLYDWQGINITYSNPQSGNYAVTGWTTSISFTAGPVYIESSYLYYCRHAVASARYGYYVCRYCIINMVPNNSYMDMHGAGYPSGRAFEIYDDTFLPYYGAQGVAPRGGGGVIFNNTFNGTSNGVHLEQDSYNSSDPNNPQYINDMWIWNNTYINVGTNVEVDSNVGIVAGVNYFKDASDGTAATSPAPPRPNYTPYTYPHPLTLLMTP
jgi:hypothetical protein